MRISKSGSSLVIASLLLGSTAAEAANRAPTISGTPPAYVQVKKTYRFFAAAKDADGDKVTFSIANKPSWAWFDAKAGTLGGEPQALGKYSNIVISASDGKSTVALPAFSIVATADGQAPLPPVVTPPVVKPPVVTPPAPTANRAPTLSGTPSAYVQVKKTYRFFAAAMDADGDKVTFSIANKPSWAWFDAKAGILGGEPQATGSYSNIVISATDGKASVSLPAFSITATTTGAAPTPTPVPSSNAAPVIKGVPATAIAANAAYVFQPTASDSNGDKLSFSISNKPSWAVFNTTTGQLSGTPSASDVASYGGISISVSDGKTVTNLSAFAIAVTQISTGVASLAWTPPTQNTDGSSLVNLAGYRIYYGSSASSLNQVIDVNSAGIVDYVIENLGSGTHYFAVKAFNSKGAESAMSTIASKKIL
jgi:hypothetical protein